MIIDSVTLRGFRGVPNELEVSFTAPLTVLYAPNGTGKTTVCDGIEWLLTGGIHRLSGTDAGPANWSMSTGAAERHLVEGTIRVGDTPLTIARTGAGRLVRRQDRLWRVLADTDLLTAIVGAAVPASTRNQRSDVLEEWVRAAWFFDGQAFDGIVDATPEGRALRARAFATLFGTGELKKQSDQLERVLQEMGPSWVDAGVESLRKLFADRRAQDGRSRGEHDSAQILTERLRRLERIAGVAGTGDLSVGRVQNVALALGDLDRSLSSSIASAEKALKMAGEVKFQTEQLERLSAERQTLEARVHTARGDAERALLNLASARSSVEAAEAVASRVGAAVRAWVTAAADIRLTVAQSDLSPHARLIHVEEAALEVATADQAVHEAARALETWGVCLTGFERWKGVITAARAAVEARTDARVALGQLRPPDEIEAECRVCDSEIVRVTSDLREIGGTLQRLQTHAQELRVRAPEESDCPLCGSMFGDPHLLQHAIDARLSQEPAAILSLTERLTSLTTVRARLGDELARVRAVEGALASATARVAEWRSAQQEAARALGAVGLTISLLDRPDADQIVEKGHASASAAVRQADGRLSVARARQRSVTALHAHAAEAQRVASTIGLAGIGDLNILPLAEWLRSIEATSVQAAEIESSARKGMLSSVEYAGRMSERVRQTEAFTASETAKAGAVLGQQFAVQGWLQVWEWTIQRLEVRENPTVEHISSLMATSAASRAELREAVAGLPDLEAAVASWVERGRLSSELTDLRTRLGIAEAVSARRLSFRAGIVDGVRDLLERQRREADAQLHPLRATIRSIFARSQAHVVVDELDVVAEKDGALDWRVRIGDHTESELRTLSRGQRQDIALSVFLARALSIGGTAFLDEPLLHLDDLNRVGFVDTLRAVAQEHGDRLRIVITTADRLLVRHLVEKFHLLAGASGRSPLLSVVELGGNPVGGVSKTVRSIGRGPNVDAFPGFVSKSAGS